MNVILCGMMGSGKTTVGKALAARLGREWLDTDAVITEDYGEISDIFANFGEEFFRFLETQLAYELSQKDNLVISTGGGFFTREKPARFLKENGKIIFLRARVETLKKRLENDESRPLLRDGEPLSQKLSRMIKARYYVYESISDYAVDVDEKSVDEIVGEIVERLEKK